MKPVRLFTIVWGMPYLDWFERACVRSLSWPRNREALWRIEAWDLWTTPGDSARVVKIAYTLGAPITLHADLDAKTLKQNLVGSLIGQMKLCISRRAALLSATPDSIFGDGSIRSLLEIGEPPRVCVAAAPLRVTEGILSEIDAPLSNPAMVRLGLKHAHQIFKDAMVGERTNTLKTGISWRTIGEGLYAIQHRTYSSYLITPERKDVEWFRKNPRFGYYDSRFPETLIPDQRQRVVGSSDAVFVCELTQPTMPIPVIQKADAEPDKFEYNLTHHAANRGVVSIWRAEGNR